MRQFRKEKGVSLIILAITIIILLILAGITIQYGTNAIEESKMTKEYDNLLTIQHAVYEQYNKYLLTKNSNLLVGKELTQEELIIVKDQIGSTLDHNNISLQESVYVLDVTDLETIGVSNTGNLKGAYIVSYENGTIINVVISGEGSDITCSVREHKYEGKNIPLLLPELSSNTEGISEDIPY